MKNRSYLLPILITVLLLQIGGCSSDSIMDGSATGATSSTTPVTTSSTIATLTLAATPNPVSSLGTVAISATLKDSQGANVADGTSVTFSITTNPSLGSITSTATTVSGVATGTFTAGSTAGTVVVTATADGVTITVSIVIQGANVGSIQFTSASPNVIGVKGSGQTETSIITFTVNDVNGQPASDGTNVTFTLNGPNGGELLTPTSASTKSGVVTTTLQSGSVAGPVRVTATTVVNIVSISSLSTAVSIGGGIPSLPHLTLSRTSSNLAGLSFVNLQSTVNVFLADRFGNFNILQGTSVSFFTEAGAIDASNVTDSTGSTSAIFRTQNPIPLEYSLVATPFSPHPTPGFPSLLGDPVNGHSMIIAVTRGEECFVDNNGNGVFDAGTDFFPTGPLPVPNCDISEPFVDEDDDGVFDAGVEFFLDANNNGKFDVANETWDGNLMIWKSAKIAFTGGPIQIVTSPAGTFAVSDGGTQSFTTCVADVNANPLMAGSTVSAALSSGSAGTFVGGTTVTIADTFGAPTCISFSLSDAKPAESPAVPLEAATIEVTVTWKVSGQGDQVTIRSISGTVD